MFLSYLSQTFRGGHVSASLEVGLVFRGGLSPFRGAFRVFLRYQFVTNLALFNYKTTFLPLFFPLL